MNDMNHQLPKRNGRAKTANTDVWDEDRDPLDEIVAEFTERFRNGDRVSVEEYAQRYPDFASQIRELFPAVSAMEQLNCKRVSNTVLSDNSPPIEQLGDYRVIGEIARGGMGVVYEAEQVTLGRRVAMKILPRQALRSQRDVQRFQREAQTAAKLHHTNIVPVFGVGEQDGTHYIVMQLIHGVGLDEVITELKRVVSDHQDNEHASDQQTSRSSRVKRSAVTLLKETLRRDSTASSVDVRDISMGQGVQSELTNGHAETEHPQAPPAKLHIRSSVGAEYYRNVARIGLQAAQALSYAHRHDTLHRDVKPGNLLLDEEGVVWMADFGLAKAIEQDDVTWTGDVVGTLSYMAPERFDGSTTGLSDIYSLGLTLYELLTFERAYDGSDRVTVMRRVTNDALTPPRKRNSDVPRDLETIVLKAAARNPADRYETAEELAIDLENFLNDVPIAARRVSQTEQFVRWCRRNRMVASLAASVLFLLATVLTVTMAGYVHATAQHRQLEETSKLAVSALDKIYGQLAPAQLNIPSSTSPDEDEEKALLGSTQPPLTRGVALLLEDLLTFYDELSKQTVDTAGVAIKSVVANRKVGDIRRRLGEFDKSRSTYEKTIQRIENLDTNTRDSQTVRLEYARTQNGLGIVLQELHLFEVLSDTHRRAINQLDATSDSPIERFELARSLYLLHLAQQRNRRDGRSGDDHQTNNANTHLQRAVDILGELRNTYPNVPDYRFLLARCYLAYPSGCNSDGTLSEHQTQAIEILDELVETTPDVADYRYELGEAYRAIEWREYRRKRDVTRPPEELAKSEDRLRRALAVTADLETQHPIIPQYYVLKKSLHHILASVLEDEQNWAEAERHYKQAIESQRQVVKQSDEPNQQRVWLYHVQLDHAQLLRDLGRDREARVNLEAIVGGFEDLLSISEIKEHRRYGRWVEKYLGQSYATLASVLHQLDETESAESILRKAERFES